MKTYAAYCFDLDGTVYRGKQAIDSAVTFIHALQAKGIEPYYLTNNSSKTQQQLQQALAAINIEAPLSHIYSSAYVTARYIAMTYPQARVKMVGSDGLKYALLEVGLTLTDKTDADVFVIGMDRQMTYEKIADACRTIQRGAKFIATNEDIKFPAEDVFLPGNGSFARLIAGVCQVEPLYMGKPSAVMLDVIQQEHHLVKEQMVMVGDNYDTDILCGIHYGIDTIHVNTGVTPTKVVQTKAQQPTYCIENLMCVK